VIIWRLRPVLAHLAGRFLLWVLINFSGREMAATSPSPPTITISTNGNQRKHA
jgi:hypothetical protein